MQDEDIVSALNQNTVGNRMEKLRNEAKQAGEDLDSKNPTVKFMALKKSKQILDEFCGQENYGDA